MDEEVYWLSFACCNGIGPVKFKQLLHYFKTAENAWKAKENEIIASGIGNVTTQNLITFRKVFNPYDYTEKLKKLNIHFITSYKEYPQQLQMIERPPYVLFVRGNISLLQQQNLFAVVGTRKMTSYGEQVTQRMSETLVEAGYIIVSGLALGIDSIAHITAIKSRGSTIAVLGSGVDVCTPRENEYIYSKILSTGGAIVSELPIGHKPNKGSFPARNRIISGLSQGVLITEGAEDSGSLITASYALKSNRAVLAVPGPITSNVSTGPNLLISKGAKMVLSSKDLLNELKATALYIQPQPENSINNESAEEQKLLQLLQYNDLHFDELVKITKMNTAKLGSLLTIMEMKGFVRQINGGYFMKEKHVR